MVNRSETASSFSLGNIVTPTDQTRQTRRVITEAGQNTAAQARLIILNDIICKDLAESSFPAFALLNYLVIFLHRPPLEVLRLDI